MARRSVRHPCLTLTRLAAGSTLPQHETADAALASGVVGGRRHVASLSAAHRPWRGDPFGIPASPSPAWRRARPCRSTKLRMPRSWTDSVVKQRAVQADGGRTVQ